MLDELLRFAEWANGSHTSLEYDDTATFYKTAVEESFARQFTNKWEEPERDTLRVSSLGKPCVLQALKCLGYHEPPPARTMRYIFHQGDIFEAYITMLAKVYGFEVVAPQAEVEFMGVKGHIDFILQSPRTGEQALIEVKTMSGSYWNKFSKEVDDTRGYLTQGAIYSHCLSLPLYWLVLDKSRNMVHIVEPIQEDFDRALAKAERIVPRLREVEKFADVLRLFKAPPGVPEFTGRGRNREATGNYTLVEAMQYSPFRYVFYELEAAKKWNEAIEYIVGVNDPDTAEQVLKELST